MDSGLMSCVVPVMTSTIFHSIRSVWKKKVQNSGLRIDELGMT